MRILGKILYVLFVFTFIFSVGVSIIFFVSSTTISNTERERKNIFYTSYNKLTTSKQLTFISTMPYFNEDEKDGVEVQDRITCKIDTENTVPTYNCSMISRLYNSKKKVIKTSYFPGDGYKYTNRNVTEHGTKEEYSNDKLISYFSTLAMSVQTYLALLTYDERTIEAYKVNYYTNVSFSFNSFSLSKDIGVNYIISGSKQNIKLCFDNKDAIKKIDYVTNDATLKISYNKTKFSFPSFALYKEAAV